MPFYRRRLPHWDVVGEPLFVTFRLHGSLPANRFFPPENVTSGEAFAALDNLLDRATSGPLFLAQPEIAAMVQAAIHAGDHRFHRYALHAFVIMPNHVHMLVTPAVPSPEWLGRLKSFTATMANKILRRQGPFWQHESYDRLVRDAAEFRRIARYIESNPVKAGLAAEACAFPWSSAFQPKTNTTTA